MNYAPPSAARAARRAAPRRPQPVSGWTSLATRIFAVNILALVTLAGGVLYLDSFATRLYEARRSELEAHARVVAQLAAPAGRLEPMLAQLSLSSGTRLRVHDPSGALVIDNWTTPGVARFTLEDPARAGFPRRSARMLDSAIEWLSASPPLPAHHEPAADIRASWPEAGHALARGTGSTVRRAPERAVVVSAAARIEGAPGHTVLLTESSPDLTESVRRERGNSFLLWLGVLGISLALSFFLARTIVRPLRHLSLAAHRVRLGRSRHVVVPRMTHRRDEIGWLARALADMTTALRQRIDATEHFAADVAHELKNPLASLRSAVEALGQVRDPAAREQLFRLIEQDVRRIDRLVSDISAASRVDAELSRARLVPVDVGQLAREMAGAMAALGPATEAAQLVVEAPADGRAMVLADPDRLGQVLRNLVDNALSFSQGAGVCLSVWREGGTVLLAVDDLGPGVAVESRQSVFERFYSERPGEESFGQHSGLGLSIARTIVEALEGSVSVTDRPDGRRGARFLVALPAM